MNISIFLLSIYLMALSGRTFATELNSSALYGLIIDSYKNEEFTKLNRVTRQGVLSSCELEFSFMYRDYRARGGAPVKVTGSFSSMYRSGTIKVPSFALKFNTYAFDIEKGAFDNIFPEFTNVVFNSLDFQNYKVGEFQCESGGKCTGYSDNSLRLNSSFLELDDQISPSISWSLDEGGMDNRILLKSLSKDIKPHPVEKFALCNAELTLFAMDDLQKQIEGKRK